MLIFPQDDEEHRPLLFRRSSPHTPLRLHGVPLVHLQRHQTTSLVELRTLRLWHAGSMPKAKSGHAACLDCLDYCLHCLDYCLQDYSEIQDYCASPIYVTVRQTISAPMKQFSLPTISLTLGPLANKINYLTLSKSDYCLAFRVTDWFC